MYFVTAMLVCMTIFLVLYEELGSKTIRQTTETPKASRKKRVLKERRPKQAQRRAQARA